MNLLAPPFVDSAIEKKDERLFSMISLCELKWYIMHGENTNRHIFCVRIFTRVRREVRLLLSRKGAISRAFVSPRIGFPLSLRKETERLEGGGDDDGVAAVVVVVMVIKRYREGRVGKDRDEKNAERNVGRRSAVDAANTIRQKH